MTGSASPSPKAAVVVELLRDRHWLELGCIVFSQYCASIQWLAEHLTGEFLDGPIALYSSATASGIMGGGQWTPAWLGGLLKRSCRASNTVEVS